MFWEDNILKERPSYVYEKSLENKSWKCIYPVFLEKLKRSKNLKSPKKIVRENKRDLPEYLFLSSSQEES